MTIEGNVPAGQSGEPVATPEPVKQDPEFVPFSTHRILLDEKKKAQAKLDALLEKEKERQEAEAKKRGDFETILKAREDELKLERDKRANLEETISHARKMNAIIEALGGNVDQRWHKLIDTTQVIINPETQEVDTMTVAKFAESLKREFPEISRGNARLPDAAPKGGGNGMIAYEDWKKLPLAEMKKFKQNQILY